MYNIQIVDAALIIAVIEGRHDAANAGLYLCELSDGKWVAVDNKTGDAWTEEFTDQRMALKWLMDEYETPDLETVELDYIYLYMADLNEEAKKRANDIYIRLGWGPALDNELVATVKVRRRDI